MKMKFKPKPIPVPYKEILVYKVFQGLLIMFTFTGINFKKFHILTYLLNNKVPLNEITEVNKYKMLKDGDSSILTYLLGKKMIRLNRGYFYITDFGKEEIKKMMSYEVFLDLVDYSKLLKKNITLVNQILKKKDENND